MLHLYLSPLKMLSSPTEASKRFLCAIRGGFLSSFSVPGAGMLSSVEVSCEARQGVGSGILGVAFTPLHASPASNSWSAVNPLRSIAGCPLSRVETEAHPLLGSVRLKQGVDPAVRPLSNRQLNPIHGPRFPGNWYSTCVVSLNFSS